MKLRVTDTFNNTSLVYYSNKYRQIVSMGGSRSSKSYSILQILMLELIRRKGIKITVWRKTKVTCRQTVLEDFQKIILFNERIYKDFKENKQTGTFIYMPTGSKIVFEGADNIGKVLGSTQDISFFNEVTEFSKAVYLQITQRTADKIFCDYNPHKDFWLEKYREDNRTVFIHSTFKDNAYCPENIVEQLLSYEPWEANSYKVDGMIVTYQGAPISITNQPPPNILNIKKDTASVYMWMVYGLGIGSEKPNRIYRGWKVISLEYFNKLDYTSYFGLDFGQSSPTACVEVKYNGDGAFYICPRYYKPLEDIEGSLTTQIKLKIPQIKRGSSLIVADSAKDSYIQVLKNAGHMVAGAIKGGGSIASGVSLVQAFTIYYVHTNDFVYEYDNYSWTIDRYEKSTDVPLKLDDHYMDAMRYIIAYLTAWLNITT